MLNYNIIFYIITKWLEKVSKSIMKLFGWKTNFYIQIYECICTVKKIYIIQYCSAVQFI